MSLSKEDVRRILTGDWVYRKQRQWPLIDVYKHRFTTSPKGRAQSLWLQRQPESLYSKFNLLEPLMVKHRGMLAVCGGAVTNCVLEYRYNASLHQDVDIFFYGVSQDEATAILEDCIATLVSSSKNHLTLRVERRQHITNVVLSYDYNPEIDVEFQYPATRYRVYQFVHRLYPTLDSILGGFDIPLSMFALAYLPHHDEASIVGTPLAIFCATYNVIIVDTTRRSFSYEHRILKYKERYSSTVFFPGLDPDQIKNHFEEFEKDKRMEKKINRLERLMEDLGLKLIGDPQDLVEEVDSSSKTCQDFSESDDDEYHDEGNIRFTNMQIMDQRGIPEPARPCLQDYDSKWLPAIMNRYTDYSDSKILDNLIPAAIGSMLRCNNFGGIFVHTSYPPRSKITYSKALENFRRLVSHPTVVCDVDGYLNTIDAWNLHEQLIKIQTPRWQIGHFAEYFRDLRSYTYRDHLKEQLMMIKGKLAQRMLDNSLIATKLLTGIKWITDNPGRQWTASFNPIMEDPRDFYGEHYVPFTVGIPSDIESMLRLFRLRDTVWKWLPRDIFKFILTYVVRNYM